jgi:hypothetical protein
MAGPSEVAKGIVTTMGAKLYSQNTVMKNLL